MKIKGVYTGKKYGKPIEYSSEEKVPLAVRMGLHDKQPLNERTIVGKITCSSDSLRVYPKSNPSEKSFSNNTYLASGEVEFQRNTLEPDKLFPKQRKQFKIEFEDTVDDLGQPELKVINLDLT